MIRGQNQLIRLVSDNLLFPANYYYWFIKFQFKIMRRLLNDNQAYENFK